MTKNLAYAPAAAINQMTAKRPAVNWAFPIDSLR